jgi:hypothetical protein
LFCTQFDSHVCFDVFSFGVATINFTLSFHAYFDYNHLE